jgi:hypothetical protein
LKTLQNLGKTDPSDPAENAAAPARLENASELSRTEVLRRLKVLAERKPLGVGLL